ncbi:MAG: malonyl-[acyl-carrier protein] O-methyltransferase BioC [Oceanospirillales bacterium LUC14_002_19_P2]|nr:MAG: malonyl-[acyl-carrier protein] O-methyltransferase BioC [Oceanospirillales bacterium LUC14_002_19_P2]
MIQYKESALCPRHRQRIAENFSRAAKTYDSAATLQRIVARKAMLGLPSALELERILDLGSGTGRQTMELQQRYPAAQVVGMDMAMGMLQHAQRQLSAPAFSWCAGDIEALPFASDCFDLVFSSLAIQWCESLTSVLQEVQRILKPGGYFVFSSLASGSLMELAQAWRKVDGYSHINHYETLDVRTQQVAASGFESGSLKQQAEVLHYPDVNVLLKELRALGVNTVTEGARQGLMTRRRLLLFRDAYETLRVPAGLPLTYQVVYGVLRKPR